MKKVLLTVLAGLLAGMTFVPAFAQDDEKKYEFNGMVRARYEYADAGDPTLGSLMEAFLGAFPPTPVGA